MYQRRQLTMVGIRAKAAATEATNIHVTVPKASMAEKWCVVFQFKIIAMLSRCYLIRNAQSKATKRRESLKARRRSLHLEK